MVSFFFWLERLNSIHWITCLHVILLTHFTIFVIFRFFDFSCYFSFADIVLRTNSAWKLGLYIKLLFLSDIEISTRFYDPVFIVNQPFMYIIINYIFDRSLKNVDVLVPVFVGTVYNPLQPMTVRSLSIDQNSPVYNRPLYRRPMYKTLTLKTPTVRFCTVRRGFWSPNFYFYHHG